MTKEEKLEILAREMYHDKNRMWTMGDLPASLPAGRYRYLRPIRRPNSRPRRGGPTRAVIFHRSPWMGNSQGWKKKPTARAEGQRDGHAGISEHLY